MPARTVSTTQDVEDALLFLSREKGLSSDDYLLAKLSDLFDSLVSESNKKKYDAASKILESKDPAKIIPALKELLL